MRSVKFLLVAGLLCACCWNASAQAWKDVLSGVAKSVVGDKLTNEKSIIGTWAYVDPDCQFESDNMLAKAGGEAASGKIEEQLAKLYEKLGMNEVSYVFNEDSTYSSTMKGVTTKGAYTFDAEAKTIAMKTRLGLSMTAHVVVTGNTMSILFEADKLLSGLQAVTNLASKVNSNASLISDLSGSYDGMMLGFELKKQ